ncbi:MAG: nitroreductase family protein [Spirochaetaceae bacterium]|jgi:nitroreductase|nr:nitroreductase family protein [Spirochaetaceae bacterium]
MKKVIVFCGILSAAVLAAGGLEAQENTALGVMLNHYAARNFAAGEVGRADLERIIQAGIHSPSAGNRQPWRFTVVRTQSLASRIVPNITEGNVLIVISAPGDGKTNGREILDCGLAAETMYLAAQSLGLGSRIYTGPIDAVNSQLKAELGLPQGHSAVVLVRVGRLARQADAASAASPRRAADETVVYK